MPDYDAGFKICARESGRDLARLAGVASDAWEPIAGEVHAAERLADRAFRARHGDESFIVYMVAYTRWDPAAPWSILAKSGLLCERERLSSLNLVYVLMPRGYRSQQGTFRLEVEGRPSNQVWFREVCLWQLSPQSWWENAPGLMALFPLVHHQETPEKAVAHAAQVIKRQTSDKMREADLLTVLALFGKLATPGFDPIRIIGREAMKESPLYQEIVQEGRTEGLLEGLTKGRTEGRNEGRNEGLMEGRTEAHRRDMLEVLEARFGKAAARKLGDALPLVQDGDRWSELLRGALKCRTLGGFRRLLAKIAKADAGQAT